MTMQLGRFGVWLNPQYDDETRTRFVVEAEALGYGTAWLGLGRASVAGLEPIERMLDATRTITVATAIVNMWTNDARTIAGSYQRITARHGDRFLLGVGVGHPEVITSYQRPYDKMVDYLDQLDDAGVPVGRRILAALGPRTLELASARTAGAHPYLVVPEHTRRARQVLGPNALLAPEHKVVMENDAAIARGIGRPFLTTPYLRLRNYVDNLRRLGYREEDVAGGGSDRLVDDLVLHGPLESIVEGLEAHFRMGADHVGIQVLVGSGGDPMAYRELARVLLR
jgi:probable F420-dependent oxidoreductase